MSYNTRSPAVKRLMKEAQELSEPTELFYAKPLEDNLFEWHFTIRGPSDTDYEGGIYHGRILLPADYPMKPPNILLVTPSGRFEINRKICLSISGYHPETWRPSWSIRTALLAIIGFMPTHGVGAIGSLDYPAEERRKLAKISTEYACPQCGSVKSVLKSLTEASVADVNEAKNLATQISFTSDKAGEKAAEPVESVESKPTEKEPVSPTIAQCPPLTSPLQSASPYQPDLVTGENKPLGFASTLPMQPLSFEQWFYQRSSELKGDTTEPQISEAANNSPIVTPDSVQPDPAAILSVDKSPVEQGNGSISSSSNTTTPTPTPGDCPLEQEGAVVDTVVHHRSHTPVSPVPVAITTQNTTANIDLASIRQRQSVLLKCIILIAGVLGFILAARLNNLHGEVNN